MAEVAMPACEIFYDEIDNRYFYNLSGEYHTVPVCFGLAPTAPDSGVSLFKLAGRYTPNGSLKDLGLVKRTRKDGSTFLTYLYPKVGSAPSHGQEVHPIELLKKHAGELWKALETPQELKEESVIEEPIPIREPSRISSTSSSHNASEKCARVNCSKCKEPVYLPIGLLKNRKEPVPHCCGVQVAYIKKCTEENCPRYFFQPHNTRVSRCHKCDQ
jgi:hypothetical protein